MSVFKRLFQPEPSTQKAKPTLIERLPQLVAVVVEKLGDEWSYCQGPSIRFPGDSYSINRKNGERLDVLIHDHSRSDGRVLRVNHVDNNCFDHTYCHDSPKALLFAIRELIPDTSFEPSEKPFDHDKMLEGHEVRAYVRLVVKNMPGWLFDSESMSYPGFSESCVIYKGSLRLRFDFVTDLGLGDKVAFRITALPEDVITTYNLPFSSSSPVELSIYRGPKAIARKVQHILEHSDKTVERTIEAMIKEREAYDRQCADTVEIIKASNPKRLLSKGKNEFYLVPSEGVRPSLGREVTIYGAGANLTLNGLSAKTAARIISLLYENEKP